MDFRKLIAYVGFVVIALALWNAWQREHVPAVQTPAAINTTNTTVPTPSNSSNNNVVPTAPSASAKPVAANTPTNTAGYITVKTDVLDVVIDKQGGNIVQNSLLAYPQELNDPNPTILLNNDPSQLYVTQSGLTGASGPDTEQGQAIYQSTSNTYNLDPGQDKLMVNLTWHNAQGLAVTKIYTFYRGQYKVDLNYNVQNNGAKPAALYSYAQMQRIEPPSHSSLFHYGLFVGAAISSPDEHYQKLSFSDLGATPLNQDISDGWAAMVQHYFLSAWVPPAGQNYHYYSSYNSTTGLYTLGVMSQALNVAPHQNATTGLAFYSGPAIATNLDAVAPHLSMTIDYGWLWFISQFLFWVMSYIYKVVGNWGWSVIILTLLIKAVFYQLSAKSYRSMAHMRRLQPKMQQLKERYGDDRQKVSQAMMELYKKEKVNPLSGCLPILIQIPFFIGLYYMIIESVELRQAPFIFWIHDLSVADPYYILPIIMGVLMFLQQRLNPPAPDPMQQKVMMFLPVIFTIFFLNFPAGLVLYWITNTAIGALQQWWMLRQVNKEEEKAKSKKD